MMHEAMNRSSKQEFVTVSSSFVWWSKQIHIHFKNPMVCPTIDMCISISI
uniref:Uncharacterized protein n=1 Tax=Nelumbo nucifera TaxID=4432 RepID=A0A822ZW64_NELNU|nr:TPA_asm: hypothetical protein HUJ06_019064 [Nelumbo nucifera]